MENIDIFTFRQEGMSWSAIARETGFSRKRIVRFLKNNADYEEPFTKVTELDVVRGLIRSLVQNQPDVGEVQFRGYLQACLNNTRKL
jgi:hypothetical protein